ncbi:hypothetical protein NNC41_08075 [Enterococcus faecium]|nr:hypothetical protein [Enterococcus faecium]HAQ1518021.1 hypothetical protein [Enterococcus faecium]
MLSGNMAYENNKHLINESKKVEKQKNVYIEMKKSPLCIQYKNDNWKEVVEFVKPHSIRKVQRGRKKSELVNSGRAVIRVITKDYPIEYGDYILRLSYHTFVVLKEENFNEFFQFKD